MFIIALIAGAIGRSVLLLKFIVVDGDSTRHPGRWIDPVFGALIAACLYILLRAGVLIAVDSKSTGGIAGDLNPFFVAFLGLIAGLISEEVIEKIRTSAPEWLRISTVQARDRWAVRLKQEMTARGRTENDWVAMHPEDAELIRYWINEKRPVPALKQDQLANWVDKSSRLIFTDMPPD